MEKVIITSAEWTRKGDIAIQAKEANVINAHAVITGATLNLLINMPEVDKFNDMVGKEAIAVNLSRYGFELVTTKFEIL